MGNVGYFQRTKHLIRIVVVKTRINEWLGYTNILLLLRHTFSGLTASRAPCHAVVVQEPEPERFQKGLMRCTPVLIRYAEGTDVLIRYAEGTESEPNIP